MTAPDAPLRIVVCGSRFGARYADALATDPGSELVGLLGRGSTRTAELAARLGVPHARRIEDLPPTDAACVVVGTGLAGGAGSTLAGELLERGVAVLQEHPVPDSELAGTLALARRRGVAYRVSSLHPGLPAPRRFAAAARGLGRPLFADAVCAVPMSYVLLDVLAGALRGLRPFACAATDVPEPVAALAAAPSPMRCVQAAAAGVPLTLRVQNQLHEADPESHMHIPIRITLGFGAGVLTLLDLHGPVLWSPRPDTRAAGDAPGAGVIGPAEAPGFTAAARTLWPDGIRCSVAELGHDIRTGADPMRAGRRHLAVAAAWAQVYEALGYPEPLTGELPDALAPAEVDALAVDEGAR
ncbi:MULTISPECIES: Gfo/Idh/MocA family oxidoreductase [Pseudonocardia]|uniref:Oxidoreductase family, NAD-binding Rossmann fold n=2 Tax=Pseudonocardia TaxID=1847 RepID=A0A1Y2N057_PSEAH|nr:MULTISPECIES: Gfo/Idh/MocA family oxidoreductase [Pseudonocardia]OSY40836.1 Oxidoreductase family, NAD-binding Rossmann fold [Pseudonocardia autotrophica]TDN71856.1 thiazolinyl imide reductase [Pseudonocardia autotrophica]BBG02544.1 hypothetical protein Pdca_37530 [Pseudonocardia autotrophica]GEC29307.1 hypothetical protein PSA01_63360 [Pseudonocardia saturnea]